jgi:hypothetical protein
VVALGAFSGKLTRRAGIALLAAYPVVVVLLIRPR